MTLNPHNYGLLKTSPSVRAGAPRTIRPRDTRITGISAWSLAYWLRPALTICNHRPAGLPSPPLERVSAAELTSPWKDDHLGHVSTSQLGKLNWGDASRDRLTSQIRYTSLLSPIKIINADFYLLDSFKFFKYKICFLCDNSTDYVCKER